MKVLEKYISLNLKIRDNKIDKIFDLTTSKELKSFFNDIIFKVDNEDLIIATTRPELLPACVAVFYHPDDKRYQKYKGKFASVPMFGFKVPILPDERADPEKGTGIVKHFPAMAIRCKYCSVQPICSQAASMLIEGRLDL